MYSPAAQSQLSIWRTKLAEGTLSQEELREAVRLLRAERVSAYSASDRARTAKAKAAIPSADDLLDQLMK